MTTLQNEIFFIKSEINEFIKKNPLIKDEEQKSQIIIALFVLIISQLKKHDTTKEQMMEIAEDAWELMSSINELDKEYFNEP